MYAGVIHLFFLNGHLYFIGVWFGEDQNTNITSTHVSKKLDYAFKFA